MPSFFSDIANNPRRQFIDAEQVRSVWLSAEERVLRYRGSMYWQHSRGRQYLYREHSKDQRKSLGVRSPETEQINAEFKAGKAAAEARLKQLSAALIEQQRLNVALRVGRTPNVVISLLEQIRRAGLQHHFMVIGTNALYAYETHVGVRFFGDETATSDIDSLCDSHKRITLLANGDGRFDKTRLIGVLRKLDSTFQIEEKERFRAVNAHGYMIDVIERQPLSLDGDFWVAKIRNLDWLLSAPKFKQVVVGSNGKMAEMITVDPRAFTLYKVYLAQKDDRDQIKAPHDITQAQAVYNLVQERMPHLSFDRIHNCERGFWPLR